MGGIIAQPPKDVKADVPDSQVVNSPLLWVAGAASVVGDTVPSGIETEANVFTFLSFSEYLDGSVDDFGVSIDNQSNENVYLEMVDFEAEWYDNGFSTTPCCVQCGKYFLYPTNSEYLSTVRPDSSTDVNLYTNTLNTSISPPHGLPPFSGRNQINVTVNLLTSTLGGMSHIPLSTSINAPRGDWRVRRW